jgi:hypothetical protein
MRPNHGPRDQIVVRIPPAMREWIETQAKHHLRSRNAQILTLIKAAQMREERHRAGAE